MNTLHLVDPALIPPSNRIPSPGFRAETLTEVRASMLAKATTALPSENPAVKVETLHVELPEKGPAVRMLTYRPTQARGPLPVLLHLHGGGYVVGSPERKGAEHRKLAIDLGCAIYSVDYRLAPEVRFPGAIDDCYAVLRWLHQNASKLDLDMNRIAVMGESAGGGLAACLALLVRDRAEFRFCFQLLVSPMLDDRTAVNTNPNSWTGEFAWTWQDNAFGWSALLGSALGAPDVSPYAAAARAQDLRGLPPTFLSIAALDLLIEEEMDYARRLAHSGVPLEVHVYPGTFHGFVPTCPEAPVSLAAARDSFEALQRALRGLPGGAHTGEVHSR